MKRFMIWASVGVCMSMMMACGVTPEETRGTMPEKSALGTKTQALTFWKLTNFGGFSASTRTALSCATFNRRARAREAATLAAASRARTLACVGHTQAVCNIACAALGNGFRRAATFQRFTSQTTTVLNEDRLDPTNAVGCRRPWRATVRVSGRCACRCVTSTD